MTCDGCNCYFSFWSISCPFTLLIAQIIKIEKKKKKKKRKKSLGISSIYTSVPKIIIICYTVPEIWCLKNVIVIFHFGILFALFARVRQTDGQMDGSTEKVTHRGGCPTQNKAWHKKTR